ncbi:hypothetical protein AB833_20570 [Chromatiales bacterium (ex Bugula neritina AB1)]|nr:hypothetical protein AB833_20570 [Chromatiales bacterium (ex Bugula neritina AB1)]
MQSIVQIGAGFAQGAIRIPIAIVRCEAEWIGIKSVVFLVHVVRTQVFIVARLMVAVLCFGQFS